MVVLGYAYTIEKPTKTDVFDGKNVIWKCELQAKNSCIGRGNSFGLMAPFTMTQAQNHIPDPIRKEVLRNDEK